MGRGPELATVDDFLDGLLDGAAALMVTGAAGIGKTTMWKETLAAARERSYLVLSTRPASPRRSCRSVAWGTCSTTLPTT